jgi:hypothetical protein
MSPGVLISYSTELIWDLDYGNSAPVNEEGRAVGAWTLAGVTVNHDFDNVSPDRLCIGGVAFFSGGLPSGPSAKCYTLRFYIPACEPEESAAISVVPYNYSSTLTWTFVDDGGSYAPDFNGQPVASQLEPVASPVVFPSVSGSRICGDVNCDRTINVSDAVQIINWIFKGGNPPCTDCPLGACESGFVCGDNNCDNQANVSDAVNIISWIFKGGPPPCHGCP